MNTQRFCQSKFRTNYREIREAFQKVRIYIEFLYDVEYLGLLFYIYDAINQFLWGGVEMDY